MLRAAEGFAAGAGEGLALRVDGRDVARHVVLLAKCGGAGGAGVGAGVFMDG